jgi:hypothetical protein
VDEGTISQYCGGNVEPCADLTIAINGTTYGTVANPCGATADVDVEDSNGNPVGSLVGGAWVIPDTIIDDQDGNQIDTVVAGGTYVVIVVSGIDGGVSNTTYTNNIIQP